MKLIALMKKEFRRFFHDPRLIVTMLIPGLIIYLIYSILGDALWSKEQDTYSYKAYVAGESRLCEMINTAFGSDEFLIPAADEETARKEVEEGKADAQSSAFYAAVTGILSAYEDSIANKFDIAADNFSSDSEIVGSVLGGMLPFLVVIFIFAACMSITLESVAGEKERGTLATILITSAKRSHVALGKVIPLSCISAIGATSSFLGVALSMPKLMGMNVGGFIGSVGFLGYFLLFLLILSVVPLIVSLVSVVSTYSKSVKEASAYTSVLMIITMVLSIVSTFVSGIGNWVVAIPVLNAVVCMQGVLTGSFSLWQSLVSVAVNIAFTALLVFAIAKMLSSERVMFGT